MKLFSISRDKSLSKGRHGIHKNNTNISNGKKKKKKKSLLKRLFASGASKRKKRKSNNKKDRTEGVASCGPGETGLPKIRVSENEHKLVAENSNFKGGHDDAIGVHTVDLNGNSTQRFQRTDSALLSPPKAKRILTSPSSPLPIYTDDDSCGDCDHYRRQEEGDMASPSSDRNQRNYAQHVETLDVTQELSFSSSVSIWTKNSSANDDSRSTSDSADKRDSEYEESEEEKTFNGMFDEEIHALEDTLEQLKSLSDHDESNSSWTGSSKADSRNDDDLPLAPSKSPPHRSLILPELSPIHPSETPSHRSIPVPVPVREPKTSSAPRSPSPTSQLDAIVSASSLAISPLPSPVYLERRTLQEHYGMDNGSVISTTHCSNDEASVSTNNSVYLDCINSEDDNLDTESNETSILTTDPEVCKNLLVEFDEYSNQYSLGLQIRKLAQEREDFLVSQRRERELHQTNYKAFCDKIRNLEHTCFKHRQERQSLIEQLAHQSVLHRQSVFQLSMFRKYQEEQLSGPMPDADELLRKFQEAVQKEGAAILDRFLLDDENREQLEQQLEDSLNERHQLVTKFGQELGIQLAKHKQLEERYRLEQSKYNRQVSLNVQLEQQVFQLQRDFDKLQENYSYLQEWQAAMIRKHRRRHQRFSPFRENEKRRDIVEDLDDDDSDVMIMEA